MVYSARRKFLAAAGGLLASGCGVISSPRSEKASVTIDTESNSFHPSSRSDTGPKQILLNDLFEKVPEPFPSYGTVYRNNHLQSDRFPDLQLTTRSGEQVRFYSDLVKDRFVVINFLYTRCDGI